MSLDGSSEVCPVTWLNSSGWKVTSTQLRYCVLLFFPSCFDSVDDLCLASSCPVPLFVCSSYYLYFSYSPYVPLLLVILFLPNIYFLNCFLSSPSFPYTPPFEQDLLFLQELNDDFAALSTDFKKNPSIWKNW